MTELAGKHLIIYLPDLSGGGAERLHIHLAPQFLAAGLKVTFLLNRATGALLTQVPEGCEVVALNAPRLLAAFPRLVRYLKQAQPDFLISNMEHTNILCPWAVSLAGVPTKIVATQHISLLEQAKRTSWQFRIITRLYRLFMKNADAIVCVSQGVATELSQVCGLPPERFEVINNGLVHRDIDDSEGLVSDHPAFSAGKPVVLAVGRMVDQKDHRTLIRAVQNVDAILMILGDGPLKPDLLALAADLGITDRVVMAGFVQDPKPYMRAARLLALSSRFEGFGNVLVEAMACATPVVSTDCPYGPSEILAGGRYGLLAPVGDATAMASALTQTLAAPPADASTLRARAQIYSIEACARHYTDLLIRLTDGRRARAAA
jgi:glycosyltransferase involved in cell wall biosynthesis